MNIKLIVTTLTISLSTIGCGGTAFQTLIDNLTGGGGGGDTTTEEPETLVVESVTAVDSSNVEVVFNVAPSTDSAQTTANYTIDGLTVFSASLSDATVNLTTSVMDEIDYTIQIP